MNSIELASKLKLTTYFISSFTGKDPLDLETCIGMGSGVAINEKGDLLTAAHVITGRIPLRQEDIQDQNVKIVAKTETGLFIQYLPFKFVPSLNNPRLKEQLTVDLAVLRPLSPQKNIPFMPISTEPIILGEQILMAGYPDDMELPFLLDQIINQKDRTNEPVILQMSSVKQTTLMIKSGMIGHIRHITLTDGQQSIEPDHFYIDNQLHSGASGGPVVDQTGKVKGIITQRAITSVPFEKTPDLKVPSGSTIAVSAKTILPFLEKSA